MKTFLHSLFFDSDKSSLGKRGFPTSNPIKLSIYFVAAIRLLPGISLIASSQSRISLGQYAVTQIVNDITNLKNVKVDKGKQKNVITNEFKDLRFKNVDFSYQNTGTPVLKNINFELYKNKDFEVPLQYQVGTLENFL